MGLQIEIYEQGSEAAYYHEQGSVAAYYHGGSAAEYWEIAEN